MTAIKEKTFHQFLKDGIEGGGFTNDDVISVIMPLLEEVNTFHIEGNVAPLDSMSSLLITNEKLDIDERLIKAPSDNLSKIKPLLPSLDDTFEISAEVQQSTSIGESNSIKSKNHLVQTDLSSEINFPVYLLNYKCYEIELGHHDAVSDIYVLGMILASLALNLDFYDEEDLISFADNRESMMHLNEAIHPSIANIISGMTQLDRRKRWKDLGEIIDNLKNYREYNPEAEQDLAALVSTKSQNKQTKQQFIQGKLRNRLFDMSRRNRLLYFKPNLKFLNLSVSSVPSVLNYKNIDPETLFYWNKDVAEKITKGKDISLSKYIRFEDNAYISPSLDRIRLEANKDINEYGFSQLKLVIGFLNWYNTKEQVSEKICSPLILIPVNIVKKKGVKDQFILEIVDSEAEINPVLSFMLKDLYDIRLPETIQLSEMSMEELFRNLKLQVEKTRSGIILEHASKPKIKLIHAQAKQTLSQYKRKVNKTKKVHSFHNLDYSYSAENFQPLGLQLFRNYVKPEHSSLEFLINSDIKPAPSHFTDPDLNSTTRELYQLDEGSANPFKWEFDTCNLVLGNFNYKKMSLVRDYTTIIDEQIQSSIFDSLFSDLPKTLKREEEPEINIAEQFNVVQSDPTQNRSVTYSRKGESYIIQGPPGTGKSQTISNLVADYVARGKKVLFVCEKRAAIDVVYHRLKQQGLDQLCCLIHDSQTDKKEFVLNLKTTFEQFTKKPLSVKETEQQRNSVVPKMKEELSVLRVFHSGMQKNLEDAGVMMRELIEILLSTKKQFTAKDLEFSERLPGYQQWLLHGSTLEKMAKTLKELSGSPFYSNHPFRYLSEKNIQSEKASFELKAQLEKSMSLLNEISERLEIADIPEYLFENFSALKDFLTVTCSLLPLKEKNMMDLLTPQSEIRNKLNSSLLQLENLNIAVQEALLKNTNWLSKFSEADAETAHELVSKYEKSFFSFLNSGFRKTKKAIHQSYDFSKHQVKPSLTQLTTNLKAEYQASTSLKKEKQNLEQFFGLGDLHALLEKLKETEHKISTQVLHYAKDSKTSLSTLKELQQVNEQLVKLNLSLAGNVDNISDKSLKTIESILEGISDKAADLAAIAPLLKELSTAHTSLKTLVSEQSYTPSQIKSLLAKSSLDKFYSVNRDIKRLEGEHLLFHISKIKKLHKELLHVNAGFIIAKQQERLNKIVQLSEMSMAGKSNAEKEDKRLILEGRKILENEFGKSMRFKSIRELATSESGQIIRELKPVWLMSPLSVSDTLPLRTNYFDVVIFDEASQITLEEGIPPVYRASQAIIVGDEMQMPPSNYFSSSSSDPDDLWEEDDEEGKLFALDADSFLTQGARKFPSVMLGWHYRSRHESLIGFSNASFYKNELLTIPDAQDNQRELGEIISEKSKDAIANTSLLLERPISYHFLKNGVYESRSNVEEAEYIAEMIRHLLSEKTGLSIGVVAFSMEQQGEIETAVEKLCVEDKEFEKMMEEEYKRVESNQFVGIFFKNLENVQGDERDIIIMSTCYGYDPKGKMIMNFGPINRRGGEKRLNVIFSRAKKHMCVVSSIKYTDIKNEYNEGANYFRKYLQYSEQASKGNMDMANMVLRSVSIEEKKPEQDLYQTLLIDQISEALREKGYFSKTLIGQSHFKCHIGIKNSGTDLNYIAGILVDDFLHYKNQDLLEQYLFKPELLRYSGWKAIQVFSKDWHEDPEKVLRKIIAVINGDDSIVEPEWEAETEIPVAQETSAIEAFAPDTENHPETVRLTCTEDNSNKFWEILIAQEQMIITYGKVGTKGQRLIKPIENMRQAEMEKEKLIQQKLKKGYKIG